MKYKILAAWLALVAGFQQVASQDVCLSPWAGEDSGSESSASSLTTSFSATTFSTSYLPTSSPTASATSSTAPSATPSSTPSSTTTSSLTPNGIKAGSAGGDAYPFWKDHIGWWYDWTPVPLQNYPDNTGSAVAVVMLWGDGEATSGDALRYEEFLNLTTTPQYILGFEEPDCLPPDSSNITTTKGAQVWNDDIAPWNQSGSLLGSPSMCKQSAEDWLTPFEEGINTPWDFTAIHVNTLDMDGVNKDLDHYWDTYGKPIWVTEFACVDDVNEFTPSENQTQINQFIADIVDLLQNDDRVYAYAYSSGEGLGNTWPPIVDGQLSESGQAYLDAISKYA